MSSQIRAPQVRVADHVGSENATSTRNATATSSIAKRKLEDSTGTTVKRPALTSAVAPRTTRTALPAAPTRPPTTRTTTVPAGTRATPAGRMTAKPAASEAKKVERPKWDIKGRLQDLETISLELSTRVRSSDEQIVELQKIIQEKDQVVEVLSDSKVHLQQDLSHYEQMIDSLRGARDQLQQQLDLSKVEQRDRENRFELERRGLQGDIDTLNGRLRASHDDNSKLRSSVALQQEMISVLETQSQEKDSELRRRHETIQTLQSTVERLTAEVSQQKERIAYLEAKTRDDEMVRRKLHNAIQELKGNIRVICRARPALGVEKVEEGVFGFSEFGGARTLEVSAPSALSATGKPQPPKKWTFNFDRVFAPNSTQSQVFDEISGLVQSALDGYNVCIFTYGQTGSGKTYTMEGPNHPTAETRGMIPRAVQQIFEVSDYLKEKGWSYRFEAFFLEIYNESIRDLLTTKKVDSDSKSDKFQIKHNPDNTTLVTNLTVEPVASPTHIFALLQRASENRAVAYTQCNERSSRSHSVFQLKIHGRNESTGESATGLLNLVDLAGSERLSQSGSTGDGTNKEMQRLKETQHINKSLTCLGDVISALANKEPHIPYRNSKLTYLLQHSLGGNSKTLMFVNISPRFEDLTETLSSLRFATKVNSCEIGVARKGGKIDLSSD